MKKKYRNINVFEVISFSCAICRKKRIIRVNALLWFWFCIDRHNRCDVKKKFYIKVVQKVSRETAYARIIT